MHRESFDRTDPAATLPARAKTAVEILGGCMLTPRLADRCVSNERTLNGLHSATLLTIYRMVLLLSAEERGMLAFDARAASAGKRIGRLRRMAEKSPTHTGGKTRLWRTLELAFDDAHRAMPSLGIFGQDVVADWQDSSSSSDELSCSNDALLHTIRCLTLTDPHTPCERIDYARLPAEEIGNIHESLLDYSPRVAKPCRQRHRAPDRTGSLLLDRQPSVRKTTGSYYTHPSLVDELIRSSLAPVVGDRLRRIGLDADVRDKPGHRLFSPLLDYAALTTKQRRAGARAVLDVRVCDPACGSAAFLMAADNYMAVELARIRTGRPSPSLRAIGRARFDVLARCIYGVDVDPLAVALARASLWLNAGVPTAPPDSLDRHVKCGNSLVGTTWSLMAEGVPDAAFVPISGDDKRVVGRLTVTNRLDHEHRIGQPAGQTRTTAASRRRRRSDAEGRLVHDAWCAAFFWPTDRRSLTAPTTATIRRIADDPTSLDAGMRDIIAGLADKHRFFHWHIEFPEIFEAPDRSGFDCVLGNPPWEHMELKETEFFGSRDRWIASAPTGAERKARIARLRRRNRKLHSAYLDAKRAVDAQTRFIRESGRFGLASRRRINTYAVFAETCRSMIDGRGRVGILVPSGIATDNNTRFFFQDLIERRSLVSLLDFENAVGLFPRVHRSYKFCCLTLTGPDQPAEKTDFAFFASAVEDLGRTDRHFTLSRRDIELLNPNTHTCPIFRSKRDAALTKRTYRRSPILVREREPASNPWHVTLKQGLFNMTNQSHLFRSRGDLESRGGTLDGRIFRVGGRRYLPLYEQNMIHQFDHRYATFDGGSLGTPRPRMVDEGDHADASFSTMPRFWVDEGEVNATAVDHPARGRWMLCHRLSGRTTDRRTMIAAIVPWSAVGNSLIVMTTGLGAESAACLCANLNSLAFDYIARQKVGGLNLNFFITRQLPVIPPDRLAEPCPFDMDTWSSWIAKRVVELTCTSRSLRLFAKDCGHNGFLAKWDATRRFGIRCELDAAFFRLYGIARNDVAHILATFPIVERADRARHGYYHTKRAVLDMYDAMH